DLVAVRLRGLALQRLQVHHLARGKAARSAAYACAVGNALSIAACLRELMRWFYASAAAACKPGQGWTGTRASFDTPDRKYGSPGPERRSAPGQRQPGMGLDRSQDEAGVDVGHAGIVEQAVEQETGKVLQVLDVDVEQVIHVAGQGVARHHL